MAKKNILVDIYLANNLGDDLFLDHLSHSFQNTNFTPYHPGTNYEDFYKNYKNIKQFPYSVLDKFVARLGYNKLTDYRKLAKTYDGLLFLGGGIFREESYWKELYEYRSEIINAFKLKNKKVFFSGCNFGPYHSNAFIDAHNELFKQVDKITFRDLKSYQLFSSLGNTSYAPDLLWSLKLPKVTTQDKVLGISVIDPRHKNNYRDTYKSYIDEHIKFCTKYIELGYKIKLFSFCEPEGDYHIAQEIKQLSSEIEILNYKSNISSYLEEIGRCSIFVAARFHAVILAFKFGIPVIPVIYSDKTENLLKDLNFEPPFVFLDNISAILDADFITLDEGKRSSLYCDSNQHLNLKF